MQSLNILESMNTLQKHGIKTAEFHHAIDDQLAMEIAEKIGFPIVMKAVSASIIHKTEAGAVKVGLSDVYQVKEAFNKMKELQGFQGVLIQKMIKGTEVIIGGKKDDQFGPTILFGLGGIFVEVLKDYSLRICPITRKDAREMIHEIKGLPLLLGVRGNPKANLNEIENTLLKVSKMLVKENKIMELDINPLMATENELIAVDARIII